MTVLIGSVGRSFFYVLNKNANDNCYHGKNHDKNFIVSHLHHLLSPKRDGGNRLWSVDNTQYYYNLKEHMFCGQ